MSGQPQRDAWTQLSKSSLCTPHSPICWFIYERSRVRGSCSIYYIWFRFSVQHLYRFAKMCNNWISGWILYKRRSSVPCIHTFWRWDFVVFSEGKHAFLPPPPHRPLPSFIHCSYWRQDMLASMRPALTESFFFIAIIMGLLGLEKYPAFWLLWIFLW